MKYPRPEAIVAYDSNHIAADKSSGTLDSYNVETVPAICEGDSSSSTKNDDEVSSIKTYKFLCITSVLGFFFFF
jgi:hypothetical protein